MEQDLSFSGLAASPATGVVCGVIGDRCAVPTVRDIRKELVAGSRHHVHMMGACELRMFMV